ncbi:MAG: gliding motility-associated C-terminal domain-containing protein [Chitinophagaceae bacterium]|nr:gliding motility-associated C-terminal domain-containing protein [Chitinophagaceae bacterium]
MKLKKIVHIPLVLMMILLFSTIESGAQLCTGSLGDPVVNIDFGNGSGSGSSYSPPGYTYTSSSCPNDGSYTITSFSSGCFGNAWHTVSADHTGGGAYMLVNASYTPADFFLTTVTGLCPNTTYQFSAWIMNVLISPTGIRPNVTFTMETPSGTVLRQLNTGDIIVTATAEWKEYGFFFTTTSGTTDVVLRITNNAPGGNGNDLALDDITFRPCGPVITADIQGNNNKVELCVKEQDDYQLNAFVSPGFVNPVYQWQVSKDSGTTWIDIAGGNTLSYYRTPTSQGKFWYRLTVAENGNAGIPSCRVSSNNLEINVHPSPDVNAGPDRIVITGTRDTLHAIASGESITLNWLPSSYLSDPAVVNPLFTAGHDTYYQLTAVSFFGCKASDWVWVHVVDDVFVPTGFTPNNDGKNDYWTIPYLDPDWNATVTLYNRGGQLIYQVKGAPVNWDGKYKGVEQPMGVYVYIIHIPDGSPDRKGTMTLIR